MSFLLPYILRPWHMGITRMSRCLGSTAVTRLHSTENWKETLQQPQIAKYVEKLNLEFQELEKAGEHNKRYHLLQPISKILHRTKSLELDILGLKELSEDKEMKKLVEEEERELKEQFDDIQYQLYQLLLPQEDHEDRSLVLEVTAGIGGKEAMLFCSEMLDMYCNYCSYKNWDCSCVELDKAELGGVRHASVFISGRSAYSMLMEESGVHRVQRVPTTDKSGRIHTSTVAVAVLPQPTEIEVKLNDKDLKIETKRSSGAGGQHVNKTDSCVRITHIPTGIAVESQEERQQLKNKQLALQRLRMKLYKIQLEESRKNIASSRKEQIGLSERSDKVRTYNYNQDRITDHRINMNFHHLQQFMLGGAELDNLIDELCQHRRIQELYKLAENCS